MISKLRIVRRMKLELTRKSVVAITSAFILAGFLGCKSTHSNESANPQTAAVMAPILQFCNGFNTGDVKSAAAACTEEMSIIDDLPPHEWHGFSALQNWVSDYDADAKHKGISDEVVKIGEPKHVAVTGDRAYVVVPTTYNYKQHGKSVPEMHAILTVALQKSANGWRITGWSWAQD